MMTDISQRFVQALADLSQLKPLEVKQVEGTALNLGEFLEGPFQMEPVHLGANLPLDVRLVQQSIMQRIDVCTKVKTAACQVRLSIERSVEGNLHDPGFRAPS